MESHSFPVKLAELVGVPGAVILQHFTFLQREKALNNKVGMFDVWVKRSVDALEKQYTYLTYKQIRSTIEALESEGYLFTKVENEHPQDRTKSYQITPKTAEVFQLPKRANAIAQTGKWNCPNGQMELPSGANPYSYNSLYNSYNNSIKGEENQNPPLPDSEPLTIQKSVEACEAWLKENPEQIRFWKEIARVQLDESETRREVAAFISHYWTGASEKHAAKTDPVQFFADGFQGWLIKSKNFSNGSRSKGQNGRTIKKIEEYGTEQPF